MKSNQNSITFPSTLTACPREVMSERGRVQQSGQEEGERCYLSDTTVLIWTPDTDSEIKGRASEEREGKTAKTC